MKKLNKLAVLAFASALVLTSCGKKDAASSGELDGEWTLSSLTQSSKIKSTDTYGTSKNVHEETATYTVNGTTVSGSSKATNTQTSGATTTIYSDPEEKISGTCETKVTFSKKDGSYEMVEKGKKVTEYTETDVQGTYYTQTTVTKVTDDYTQTQGGSYYLNQKAGETGKGTKLIVDIKSDVKKGTKTTEVTVTTTYSGTTTITTNKSTDDYTTTYTRQGSSETQVYNIVESTKSALSLEYVGSYTLDSETSRTTTSGATTTITKSEGSQEITVTSTMELTK